MMESALYLGRVRHRRFAPVPHEFAYGVMLVYLDLAELGEVFAGHPLWSARGFAPAWFRRKDHLGDPRVPLDTAVRDLVEERTGRRPGGPVRLLTNLRYWGYVMNPVSFHYCWNEEGTAVEAIVADVSNTPWNERHRYVLEAGGLAPRDGAREWDFAKEFHVSPFHGMEQDYRWRFTAPAETLAVHMENFERAGMGAAGGIVEAGPAGDPAGDDATPVFDATLTLRRREVTGASLTGALARHPFETGKTVAAIYWQALKLWGKRVPVHPHPDDARPRGGGRPAPGAAGSPREGTG
jgi:DUF1365 family protein